MNRATIQFTGQCLGFAGGCVFAVLTHQPFADFSFPCANALLFGWVFWLWADIKGGSR